MKEELIQLVALQRIDERLAILHRRMQSLPDELGERESRHNVLEAACDAVEAERKAALARMKELDIDVKTHEERITKLEESMRHTRDQGAVQVAQHEVNDLRKKISECEDEALQLLDESESLAREHVEKCKEVEAGASELEGFRKIVNVDKAELDGEISATQAERDETAGKVTKQTLAIYEKLAPSRKGRPMAPLKGDSCGGCGIVVPPNDRVKVLAMSSLARCKSCTRILVIAEVWSPQPAEAAETETTE